MRLGSVQLAEISYRRMDGWLDSERYQLYDAHDLLGESKLVEVVSRLEIADDLSDRHLEDTTQASEYDRDSKEREREREREREKAVHACVR